MTRTPNRAKSLNDGEIKVRRVAQRRQVLGLLAASGAVLTVARPSAAQATDGDNGAWTDPAGCGRGSGGTRTGMTDADNGRISDAAGRGRGAPRC